MFSYSLRLTRILLSSNANLLGLRNSSKKCLVRGYQSKANISVIIKSRFGSMSFAKNSATKRNSLAISLAGCCFSMCKKQKTEEEESILANESSKLLSSFSSKKSNNDLEIGADDLSKSIDESGAFPNLTEGVRVSTSDKKSHQKSPSIVSFKADVSIIGKSQAKPLEGLKESLEAEYDKQGTGGVKKKRKQPNYFVALQINNPQILDGLKEVQEQILRGEPKLKPALVSLKKLHITLMVFHIQDNQQLDLAVEALAESFSRVKSWLENSIDLEISKVSNFKNQVVYAAIKDDESKEKLFRMAEEATNVYEQRGFDVREGRPFNPHLTLFKLSQAPNLAKKGIRKIDPHLYQDFKEKVFGIEKIQSLQLLSMKEKDESGYYHCVSELKFGAT